MKCECAKIEKCKKDRKILELAKAVILCMDPDATDIESSLKALESDIPYTYRTDNSGEICMAIDKLDDDIKPAIRDWLKKIEEESARLDKVEEDFVKRDKQYHSNLKKINLQYL